METSPIDVNRRHGRTPKFFTRHTHPAAARLPRIVKIPLAKKFSFPTRLIRLEFDHSTVDYYAEIDTVFLCGKRSSSNSSLVHPLELNSSPSIVRHRFTSHLPSPLSLLDHRRRACTSPHTIPIACRHSTHHLFLSRPTLTGSTLIDLSNPARTLSRSTAISIAQPSTLLEWHQQLCHRAFLSPALRIRPVSLPVVDKIHSILVVSPMDTDVFGKPSAIESGLLPVSHRTLHQGHCDVLFQLGNSQSRELHRVESSRLSSVEIPAPRSIVERVQNED